MKRWIACMTILAGCARPPAAAPPAAVPAKTKPPDTLAAVDVFGAKHAASEDIIATAGFVVGSSIDIASPALADQILAAGQRLEERYGFAFINVAPISYFGNSPDAGKVFITIDVVEREDASRLKFAPEPSNDVPDPDGLIAAWIDYDRTAWSLQRAGALNPPYTCMGGMHCALGFRHPDLAHREDAFIDKAPGRVAELTEVLRGDRNKDRRAAAAFVLAYGKDRGQVIEALLPSIDDPNADVRNNVMRVLLMIQQRAETVVVPLEPALHAMHFPTTTDRNKAANLLAAIAVHASADDRARIARELGDVLVAMAALKQPNNREPAIDILRAISGEDHGADAAAWRAWLDHQPARN